MAAAEERERLTNLFLAAIGIASLAGFARTLRWCPELCRAAWADEALWSGIVKLQSRCKNIEFAARSRGAERVRKLLLCGAAIVGRRRGSYAFYPSLLWQCLQFACARKDAEAVEVVRALLSAEHVIENAVNFHDDNTYGCAPLHLSCYGDVKIMPLLIAAGANVDACGTKYLPPLFYARRLAHVAALLAAGADATRSNVGVGSLLSVACRNFCDLDYPLEIIKELARAGADVNADSVLCAVTADSFDRHETPLSLACARRPIALLQLLLELGAYVDGIDGLPLREAAEHDLPRHIEALLAAGADVTLHGADGVRALHAAAGRGAAAAMRVLLHAGADLSAASADGRAPLHFACAINEDAVHTWRESVQLLLAAGASVGAVDSRGRTPLHCAAAHGAWLDCESEASSESFGSGSSIGSASAASSDASTGSDCARGELLKVVELLLAAGADAGAADAAGITALHLAAQRGHAAVVDALLAAGAEPARADSDGFTPLHRAAECGDDAVICALLAAGADEAAVLPDGRSYIDLLPEEGWEEEED